MRNTYYPKNYTREIMRYVMESTPDQYGRDGRDTGKRRARRDASRRRKERQQARWA